MADKPIPVEMLRSLYLAEIHMREVIEGCTLLRGIEDKINFELQNCIFSGIIVSYTRSFGQNNGLSKLNAKFSKFDDHNFQTLHDELISVRNTIYLHRDRTKEAKYLPDGMAPDVLQDIMITISVTGQSKWELSRPRLHRRHLSDIEELAQYQLARFREAASEIAKHFIEGKRYKPGVYTLGVDFP